MGGEKEENDEMLKLFPSMTLEMAGTNGESIEVEFNPSNYLFRTRFSSMSHGFCVGVYNNHNSGTLLGSVMMRNYLVNFDLQMKELVSQATTATLSNLILSYLIRKKRTVRFHSC